MELQTTLPGLNIPASKPLRYFPTDIVKCQFCDTEHLYSEGLWIDTPSDGMFYCDTDCAQDDDMELCKECDDWYHIDDMREVNCDSYCDGCYDDNFCTCSGCNDVIDLESSMSGLDDECLCEDCFSDTYSFCSECDELTNRDDLIERNDEYFCSECSPRHIGEDYRGPKEFTQVGKRCFGVELEFAHPYHEEDFDYFYRGTDHCGSEYRSGILYGDGGLKAARDLASYAERNDWNMSRDCGYHLHIDMRGLTVGQLKNVAYAYLKARKLWEAFVDPSRESCGYADYEYHTKVSIAAIDNMYDFREWSYRHSRYRFINWAAYREHTTVEIRGHEGTISADEVCSWITAHTKFVDYVKDLSWDDIDDLFSGSIWKDHSNFTKVVGTDVGEFYRKKVEKHGRKVSIISDRFAPIGV